VNLDTYSDDAVEDGQGEILLNATTFRFDASDLMPGAVGQGSSGPAWSTMPVGKTRRMSRPPSRKAGTR
jgi:hypothetical protein